ncbi:MAG TPA: peptide MFS transporter [Brumimicrobium sp.]|nr:peptide MFS transporter [Brumimicrobium sp.]
MATVETIDDGHKSFFETKVLGHPAGLFVLFFTEMWERFSFYGMRVLLINFLTIAAIGSNPGWEWSSGNAGALFGTYAGLLYLTPIVGGVLADKFLGYRWAVLVGCVVMTLGHGAMALETETSLYMGLGLLVIGTGFFKPNITSIISEMYVYLPEKKDSAYTLFYMGVNSGAFFGMMLCGYLAERVGWSWGFGLAGIFMLFGTLQFLLAKPLFGKIGAPPVKGEARTEVEEVSNFDADGNEKTFEQKVIDSGNKDNKFTLIDKILIVITAVIGLLYLINDPMSKIAEIHLLPEEFIISKDILPGPIVITIIGLVLFLYLVFSRIFRYDAIVRDRMIAVIIFAFFTVLFFIPFEQAATSMVIFARDFTERVMTGTAATIFNVVNTLLTVIPLLIITWVLFLLNKRTFKKIPGSNIVLALCFALVWGVVVWMLARDFSSVSYEVTYKAVAVEQVDKNGDLEIVYEPITAARPLLEGEVAVDHILDFSTNESLEVGQPVAAHLELGKFVYLNEAQNTKLDSDYTASNLKSQIVTGTVAEIKENEVEITASWFSILNSFFIIALASVFSKWWESKYNPSAAMKYGLGLLVMSVGFAILAYGARVIPPGAEAGAVRVGMIWLILAYLFHTLGELFLSPVGLSYVSKLVPGRMIAFMFGMWYLAIAIGNKIAASLGGMVDKAQDDPDFTLTSFFLIFTIVPAVAGVAVILLNPILKKLMHGVK